MADPKGSTPEEGSYVPSAPVPSPLTPEQKKKEDKKRLEMQGVKPEGRSLTEDSPFVPPGWTPDQIQPDTELSKQEDWRQFKQEQEDFAQLSAETQEKKDKQERIDYLAGLSLSERGTEKAIEAAKVAIPIVTEIAAPIGAGIAFSPLLAGGPPGIAAYFTILGGSGFGSNALAQNMRIGYGQKEKFSWEESIAATAFSAIPGFGVPGRMSKVAFRAGQGAVMATGEAATRQTLEMGSGKRDWGDFDTMELVFAAGVGTAVGGSLGKLEVVLDVKPRAGETPEEAMRRGFREGEKQTRLDIKAAKRQAYKRDISEQERALRNEEVKQRESILEDMVNKRKDFESRAGQIANEGEILEQAVEQIRKQQEEAAKNFESLAKDIETGSTTPVDGVDAPTATKAEPTAPFSPSERAIPDEQGKVTPERLERILKKFLTKDKGHEGGESGDTSASGLLPENVSPKISELTDDPELQDFFQMLYDDLGVEVVGTSKAKRKAKVPRKVVTAKELMEKAKDAVRLIGGEDEVATYELLQQQALTSDTTGAQLEELSVRGAAYAALTSHGMRRVINNIKSTDWETSDAALNDAVVDIYKLFAGPYMGYKRVTTAHGRNLRSTQYMKDVLELDIKDVSKAMEEKFIGDLKKSGDLTPEAMQKQIDSLGEISVVKKLLAALQQSQDLEEAADILIKQQKAFQNHQTITRNLASGAELPSVYRRISDMGIDMLYSSMLSSPITHMKAKIGNTFMQYYQPFQGMLGGTYMAHAPWARRGVSKQEWLDAAKFWKDTTTGYGIHGKLAWEESLRAFYTGISDITSHFERIGLSAFGMDRTGLSGGLGQALENMGKFVDLPGRNMQRIDMFSKQRIAHSMFAADTHRQFVKEHGRAPSELEFEAAWNVRKERVFTEDRKIRDKDVVKREAVLASKEQNIPAEELPEFLEKYVAKNWNPSEERFVEYVKRNVKEVAFQDNPGEHGTAVSPIEKSLLKGEEFIKELPFIGPELTATLFPFMRTGRNILREGYSSGSAWMSSIPGTRRISDKLWTKTLADLDSPDPVIAARAKGKQIVSAAILTGMIYAVRKGWFVGTERPEDWRLQENLETATGQRADEIRIPITWNDVKTELGVDAAALEPLLTVAQVVANTQSSWHYQSKKDQSVITSLVLSAVMANAKMIESKSYYANVSKLMKMTEAIGAEGNTRYMSRTGRSLFKAGVPSGVNALNTMTDNQRRSQDYKDAAGLLQVLANRLPGISNQNPVYRDMFGDPVSRRSESPRDKWTKPAQLVSPINPLSWSIKRFDKDEYIKTDDYGFRRIDVSPVNLKNPEEVRNAAWAIVTALDITGGFNGGTSILTSYSESGVSAPLNIDLTGLKYEGIETPNSPKIGQDAFDRWQQIYSTFKGEGGRTVKEAIVKFGKHKNFKKIPTIEKSQIRDEDVRMGNDPRKTEVMKIMNWFQKASLHQLVKEYPRLRKSALNSLKLNQKREQGFGIEATTTDTEELQQLLNN